jgi:acyl-CoA thioesterase
VPTIELTVHLRRRPASGWVLARFECDDVEGGRMIESGTLWDSTGAVVARCRQLGLVLAR